MVKVKRMGDMAKREVVFYKKLFSAWLKNR
jgi:hypothetical protein